MSDDADEDRYPAELPSGVKVIFSGPDDVRLLVHLLPEHPGVVSSAGEKHADVRWVDKQDWFVHEGVFDPRWLTVVDDSVFIVRTEELRASDWDGFSKEAPGERRQ
jgi:hypothetical protein